MSGEFLTLRSRLLGRMMPNQSIKFIYKFLYSYKMGHRLKPKYKNKLYYISRRIKTSELSLIIRHWDKKCGDFFFIVQYRSLIFEKNLICISLHTCDNKIVLSKALRTYALSADADVSRKTTDPISGTLYFKLN